METQEKFIPNFGYGRDYDRLIVEDAEKLVQAVKDGFITKQQIADRTIPRDILYDQLKVSGDHSGFSFGCVSTVSLIIQNIGSTCPYCGAVIESLEHAYKDFPVWVGDENFSICHRECYKKANP